MPRFPITPRSSMAALLVAVMAAALVPAFVAAASRPITFSIYMGSNCVSGFASDGAPVEIEWEDAGGNQKAHETVVASPDGGEFTVCSSTGLVETGDQLRAESGTSVHELVVPELTAWGSRVNDVYKGRGPAGDMVKLICQFSNGFEPCSQVWKIRVGPGGKWSLKPGWDVGAGETTLLQWKGPGDDVVRTYATPAILTVRIGSARVVGTARNGAPVSIVLKRGAFEAMANPVASPLDGDFVGILHGQAGGRVRVRPGDQISSDIAADLQWVVPDIQASGDASADRVVGRCEYDDPTGPQTGNLRIFAFRNGEVVAVSGLTAHMEEDGSFDVEMEFQAGDRLLVRCGMSTGDWAEKFFDAQP